jgi:hypothetical protein
MNPQHMHLRALKIYIDMTQHQHSRPSAYQSSLAYFMAESDEISSNVPIMARGLAESLNRFRRQSNRFRRQSNGVDGRFRWLDVGAGDGVKVAKAIEVAFGMLTSKETDDPIVIDLELYERDTVLHEVIAKNIDDCATKLKGNFEITYHIYNEFIGFKSENHALAKYNLVTFIHCLYHFPTVAWCWTSTLRRRFPVFEGISKHVCPETLIVVMTEGTGSVFYEAKKQAFKGLLPPPRCWKDVRRSLTEIEFYLSRLTLASYWPVEAKAISEIDHPKFPAFLAFSPEFDKLDIKRKRKVIERLRDELSSLVKNAKGGFLKLRVDQECLIFDLEGFAYAPPGS